VAQIGYCSTALVTLRHLGKVPQTWKKPMSRSRQRYPLEAGQKLDINALRRAGTIPPALNGEKAGSLSVRYPDGFEQEITFVSRKRHYGGRQFYFVCPVTGRLCSVLWRPPGATRFCSRQAWCRQVAYAVQFADTTDRCHLAKRKICRRLGASDGDDFPPRPKRMRARTYAKWEARFEEQEKRLDDALLSAWRTRWAHLKVFV
jgi:hypothetical protein